MERERTKEPIAERVEEEEMDTSGHGDKLQSVVDKIVEADTEHQEASKPGEDGERPDASRSQQRT